MDAKAFLDDLNAVIRKHRAHVIYDVPWSLVTGKSPQGGFIYTDIAPTRSVNGGEFYELEEVGEDD